MHHRRAFLLTAGLAALTLAIFGSISSALAQSTTLAPKVTSLLLPLAGVSSNPGDPCVPLGEAVVLEGSTHVVTQIYPPWPVAPPSPIRTLNVYLNMAGVQGTGQKSGSLYIGTGSTKFIGLPFSPNPPPIFARFALEPTNGCASMALPLNFDLVFASDGTLLSESTVTIGGTCAAVGGAAAC